MSTLGVLRARRGCCSFTFERSYSNAVTALSLVSMERPASKVKVNHTPIWLPFKVSPSSSELIAARRAVGTLSKIKFGVSMANLFEDLIRRSAMSVRSSSLVVQEAFLKSANLKALNYWLESSNAHPVHLLELARKQADNQVKPDPLEFARFSSAWAAHAQFEDLLEFAKERQPQRILRALEAPGTLATLRPANPAEPGFSEGVIYSTRDSRSLLSDSQKIELLDLLAATHGGGFKYFLQDNFWKIREYLNYPGFDLKVLPLVPPHLLSSLNWEDTPEFKAALLRRLRSFGSTPRAFNLWLRIFAKYPPGSFAAKDFGFFFKHFLLYLQPEFSTKMLWWLDPEAFDIATFEDTTGSLNAFINNFHTGHKSPESIALKQQVALENAALKEAARLRAKVNADFESARLLNLTRVESESDLLRALGSSFKLESFSPSNPPSLLYLDEMVTDAFSLFTASDDVKRQVVHWVRKRQSISTSLAAWLAVWYLWKIDATKKSRYYGSSWRIPAPPSLVGAKVYTYYSDGIDKATDYGANNTDSGIIGYSQRFQALLDVVDKEDLYNTFPIFSKRIERVLLEDPSANTWSSETFLERWGFLSTQKVFANTLHATSLLTLLVEAGKGTLDVPASILDSFTGTLAELVTVSRELAPEKD